MEIVIGYFHMSVLDLLEAGIVCTGVRYVVGKEGIKFGVLALRTIIRWGFGK